MLGSTLPKFTGFSSVVKDTGISFPYFSLTTVDVADSALDSNFQLVFKKMNKKDSTTKLKVNNRQFMYAIKFKPHKQLFIANIYHI